MWINDVDIPEDLIGAVRDGSLVIFVGAGASLSPPSSLPNFRSLTECIAEESQTDYEDSDLDTPDLFLGHIKDLGFSVHERVHHHIDVQRSSPNSLHEAIVALAKATGTPRIVTTNYDSHLTSVVAELGLDWDGYMAPALPMGDDFDGIVYLHGSLRQEPRHLIVTDSDFGRAYLRDAWAARFVERMFATYTVLFVGYSHGDMVMRYLARSLGPNSNRYVLTHQPDGANWRGLNIVPIGYKVVGQSHAALPEAIAQLAQRLSMGLLDHRQQIARLVAAPPSSVPYEESYLEAVIGDADLVGLFTDLAQGEAWLRWAAARPEFKPLFDSKALPSAPSAPLASWFARLALSDKKLASVGLNLVAEMGGHLSPALWHAIGQRLHSSNSPRAEWLQPWIVLLIENAPADIGRRLDYALLGSAWPDDRSVALLLFDFLTEPRIALGTPYAQNKTVHHDLEIRGDRHRLRKAWDELLKPNLESIVHEVLDIASRHLRRSHQLLVATGEGSLGWDPVSFGRSSIATHAQDRHSDGFGVLIDAARDGLQLLATTNSSAATATIEAWSGSDAPILRRLAIHAVAVDKSRTGTEKVVWLLDHDWLFGLQLKHEVFELMEAALPSTDDEVLDRLVLEATKGPTNIDSEETREYESFNALVWIDRHSTSASASDALARTRQAHPDFEVRDHPEFSSWTEVGASGHTPPMTVEEFHCLLVSERDDALAQLEELSGTRFPFDSPSWSDAVWLVTQVVEADPTDGLVLLRSGELPNSGLVAATIRGWAMSELPDEIAKRAIDRLAQLDLELFGDEIARLLESSGDGRTEWFRFDAARQLARTIAGQLPSESIPIDRRDWLTEAINAPAGQLARFWLRTISYEWAQAGDAWEGIDTDLQRPIEELMQRDDLHGALAQVVTASQLHFFFSADRVWGQANVLPLLDWSNEERSRRTWDGYLTWGRWTDQLLEAGLLGHYLAAAAHIDQIDERLRPQLTRHLAEVALYGEQDPLEWISQVIVNALDQDLEEWHSQIGTVLDGLDADARQVQWDRWINRYWTQRVDGVPRLLTLGEAGAIAEWALHFPEAIDEAVELATSSPGGLSQHSNFLYDLNHLTDSAPAACGRLLAHLLSHTSQPFTDCYQLRDIFANIRDQAAPQDLTIIRGESLRLGCADAAGW